MTASSYWPLLIYTGAVVLTVVGMLGLSYVLGERHAERRTGEPYESGIPPTGTAELRIPAQFYLVAMLFVIFDLEAVYFFVWAVAVPETGWLGFGAMAVFTGILFVALWYEWRIGALEWGPDFGKIEARRQAASEAVRNQAANRERMKRVEEESHAVASHASD